MTAMTPAILWQRFAEAGLVQGEAPASGEAGSPWYVRVMLGVAAWIGALFLFGFVGVSFRFVIENASGALITGAVLCVAAWLVFSSLRHNDFTGQFGLAASLVGQVLFLYGLFRLFKTERAEVYLLMFAFEAALVVFLPNFLHRVWSTLAALAALAYALGSLGLPYLGTGVIAACFAIVWLHECRWAKPASVREPVGTGAALALAWCDVNILWREAMWPWMARDGQGLPTYATHLGTLLTACVFVYMAVRLLRREDVVLGSRVGIAALAGSVALMAAAWSAPGVTAALLIMLVGYASGNRFLLGLGLIALGGYLSYFYYQMHSTLLAKSAVLAETGAVLLVARAVMLSLFDTAAGKAVRRA